MDLRTDESIPGDQLVQLYQAVGWEAYVQDPEGLARAVANSTLVVAAWQEDRLIGLARCLSDDVAIVYLQDILVHPDWQGQGVGRQLLEACLKRFAHVRQKVLLTDDEERQRIFYESMGFVNTREFAPWTLNAYVMIKGLTDR